MLVGRIVGASDTIGVGGAFFRVDFLGGGFFFWGWGGGLGGGGNAYGEAACVAPCLDGPDA